ncbi:DNA primase [Candidatus Contubernalis alkaliaceticus]|uniref:DNA primase n=1 Tax=Candidatus Contubernalis alkaliaceticus TaxID=338645 RepID=UPI001F4C192E|nr:DNA primase [Candidatus Contubernalis alkalaceticus]UNC92986.1 DNA primase [Candidatus Contubernalis alkalaceticus]
MENIVPEETIEEIRQHFNLVEVISNYTALKKSGRNYSGLCPFHSEKTPSFTVSPDKQLYHCFGCGVGGNLYTFIMAIENLTFREAVTLLAGRAGIFLPEKPLSPGEKKVKDLKEELLLINEVSMKFFSSVLFSKKYGIKALNYLKGRGLKGETLRKFNIGYSPSSWEFLLRYLKNKGFSETNIEKAGLIVRRSRGSGYYDRFRDRIIFPIFNQQNQVAGFGGRVLEGAQPKYLNTPETHLYNKRKILYALNHSRSSIREKDEAIVFEGYMDVITAHQEGVENCVASLGTSLTEEQAEVLRRNASSVVIAYDSDAAGEAAAWRGMDILVSAGCRVKVAQMPQGMDPDDFIKKKGIKAFEKEIIEKSLPLIDYKLEKTQRDLGVLDFCTPQEKLLYIQKILPVLAKLNSSVELDVYLQKVSSQIGVGLDSLQLELKKFRRAKGKKQIKFGNTEPDGSANNQVKPPAAEKEILALMLKNPDYIFEVKKWLKDSDFCYPPYRGIIEKLFYLRNDGNAISEHTILRLFPGFEEQKIAAALILEQERNPDNREKIIKDCVRKIKCHKLSLKRKEIEKEISKLDRQQDGEKINGLLVEWTEIKRLEKDFNPQ